VSRSDELAARIQAVGTRVIAACETAGRDAGEVTVVVVTKTFPATDVRLLASLGVRDVGENRDQEAAPKASDCADLDLRWHFVGQLQTNKAASVARYASAVHSVDRPRLVRALEKGATAAERQLDCLVQVSLDAQVPDAPQPADAPGPETSQRAGSAVDDVVALADLVAAAEHLRLAGVMAVAPLNGDPNAAFARLERVAREVRTRHPSATWISAGMSNDLEAAVAHGATHLRVGSAILGERPLQG
jgi:pyridoxal phosphate enzyme (YggS family)